MGRIIPVRGVYGKPWSKLAKKKISSKVLLAVGNVIVEEIAKEARRDYLRTGKTPRGLPMGLPHTDRFFNSFSVDIVGESTIGISTTWEWIERHMEGREPFKMWWLTQARGVYKVPMLQEDGSIRIVSTPPDFSNAWIHPGALKFNFVSRGVKKGRVRAAKLVAAGLLQDLLTGNPLQ